MKANSVLDGVLKQNKKSGLEEGVEHKRALSAQDWDLVQEYFKKVSTSSDPVSLCCYVWFVVSLRLRGREVQFQPNKWDLVFGKDENNCDIITLSKDFMSKNHQGERQRLFQRARIASQPEDATWFMNMPLYHNLLGKMMSQISADAKLSAVYTNHCVRAISITRMKSAHFEDRKICSVSSHKSSISLQAYDRLSSNDITSMSKAIDGICSAQPISAVSIHPSTSVVYKADATDSDDHTARADHTAKDAKAFGYSSEFPAYHLQNCTNITFNVNSWLTPRKRDFPFLLKLSKKKKYYFCYLLLYFWFLLCHFS